MKNYSDLTISTEVLSEWQSVDEARFNKLAKSVGPLNAYRLMTDDWTHVGKERGMFLIKKRQQQHEDEERKTLGYKLKTLAALQRRKDRQKTEETKKAN